MNIVKLKGLIASNVVTKSVAEWILDGYTMIRKRFTGSYTKNKEDIIALELLKEYTDRPIDQMKYVDIGANHYKRGNNSYLFYEQGARGILVEADPLLCRKLKKHRSGDKIENVAIGVGGGDIPFYILSLPTRSSMDKSHVDQSVKEGLYIKEIIDIPCKNINDLLDEYCFEPDYLSIDIEGMDYRVLRMLNFEKFKIKVIVAEQTNELNAKGESMDAYMMQQGYEVYKNCGSNVIYRLKKM